MYLGTPFALGTSFTSSDNTAVLRFISDGSTTAPGFSLLVTEFNDSPCNDDFQCDTNRYAEQCHYTDVKRYPFRYYMNK